MDTVFNGGRRTAELVRRLPRERGVKGNAPHQPIKALAKRFVQEIEGRIARGEVGIEEPASAPLCGPLVEQFVEKSAERT